MLAAHFALWCEWKGKEHLGEVKEILDKICPSEYTLKQASHLYFCFLVHAFPIRKAWLSGETKKELNKGQFIWNLEQISLSVGKVCSIVLC